MHPARKLALDFVLPRIKKGWRVLDLGSGDGEVAAAMEYAGAKVVAVDWAPHFLRGPDKAIKADVTKVPWTWMGPNELDAVVATWALQHFVGRETAAWSEIQRTLKPGGVLVATGRHRKDAPFMETNRKDPLRADNRTTFAALAMASGLELVEFETFIYEADSYWKAPWADANAFGAVARRTL